MKRFLALMTLIGLISCACGRADKEEVVAECRAAMPEYSETMTGLSGAWEDQALTMAIVVQFTAPSFSAEDTAKIVADRSLKGFEDLRTEAGNVKPPACLAEHHRRYLNGMDIVVDMLEDFEAGRLPESGAEPIADSKQEMGILQYALAAYEEDQEWFFNNLDQLNVDGIALAMATMEADQELAAETAAAVAVDYIPGGRSFVTLTEDTVSFWDSAAGEHKVTIEYSPMKNCGVDDYAISPDGNFLAIPGCYGICIWDTTSGDMVTNIRIPEFGSVCPYLHDLHFAFSPDSASLVFGSRVYSVETGQEMLYLDHEPDPEPEMIVHFSEYSPSGQQLATIDENGAVRVWDAETGQQILVLGADSTTVGQEYVPIQDAIITVVEETYPVSAIRFWDPDDGTLLKVFSVTRVGNTTVDQSGRLLAAEEDAHISIWDTITDEKIIELRGPVGYVSALAFSPDGTLLAAGGSHNRAVIWEVATGQQIATLEGHSDEILGLDFSPDGRWLSTASADGTARIWDVSSEKQIRRLSRHDGGAGDVAFGAQGRLLATTSRDGPARVWDTEKGEVLLTLPKIEIENPPTFKQSFVAFNKDGSRLVTGGDGEQLVVWNAETGEMVTAIDTWTSSVAFTNDGQRVVVHQGTFGAEEASTYNATSGEPLVHLGGTIDPLDAAFTPDGERLVTVGCHEFEHWTECTRGLIRIFDVHTGRELHKLYGHAGTVSDLDISSDGRLLVTVASDNMACLWDLDTGEKLMALPHEHISSTELLWRIFLSPTDEFFLTFSLRNKVAFMWDVADGQLLQTFEGVTSAAVSPDGTRILMADEQGQAKVVDAKSGRSLLDVAEAPEQVQTGQPAADSEHLRELSADCNLLSMGIQSQSAFDSCDELISLDPDTPGNYVLRARALEGIGDFDGAIADLLTAIELGETSAETQNQLCWFYGLTASPEPALPYCQYAVEHEPIWEHIDSRGLVLGQLGDFEGAISDIQFVVDDLESETDPYLQSVRDQRIEWLETLREGGNPFTPEVLAELRGEIND